MSWNTEITATNQTLHSATCSDNTELAIKSSVLACADYAFTLFNESVEDDSMYCLFEWNQEERSLVVLVTDDTKQKEGKHLVKVALTAFEVSSEETQAEMVKYWLRDHLTTCLAFFQYSLVAGFSTGDRTKLELL